MAKKMNVRLMLVAMTSIVILLTTCLFAACGKESENDKITGIAPKISLMSATVASATTTSKKLTVTSNAGADQPLDIVWSVSYVDCETTAQKEWAQEIAATDCVTLSVSADTKSATAKCLREFIVPIEIRAALKDDLTIYATCKCGYNQRAFYALEIQGSEEIKGGETYYTFLKNGAFGNGIERDLNPTTETVSIPVSAYFIKSYTCSQLFVNSREIVPCVYIKSIKLDGVTLNASETEAGVTPSEVYPLNEQGFTEARTGIKLELIWVLKDGTEKTFTYTVNLTV